MYDALAIKLKINCARIRRIIQRAEITAQRVCIHTGKYMMAYAMCLCIMYLVVIQQTMMLIAVSFPT